MYTDEQEAQEKVERTWKGERGRDAALYGICVGKIHIGLVQFWKLLQRLEKTCYNKEKKRYLRNYQNFQAKENSREVLYCVLPL